MLRINRAIVVKTTGKDIYYQEKDPKPSDQRLRVANFLSCSLSRGGVGGVGSGHHHWALEQSLPRRLSSWLCWVDVNPLAPKQTFCRLDACSQIVAQQTAYCLSFLISFKPLRASASSKPHRRG